VLGFEPITYGYESECATHYSTAPRYVQLSPDDIIVTLIDSNRQNVGSTAAADSIHNHNSRMKKIQGKNKKKLIKDGQGQRGPGE